MDKLYCSFVFFTAASLGALISTSCISQSSTKTDEKSIQENKKSEDLQLETQYGRQLAGKIIKYFGVVNNAKATKYVNEVGNYLSRQSSYSERNFMFEILDSDSINAFSCPGGYIFITKGALTLIQDEAELAMVLSHEIVHVGNKHMLKTLQQGQNKASQNEKPKNSDPQIEARRRPTAEDSKVNEHISKLLIGSSGTGLSILEGLQQGVTLMFKTGFDKTFEFEADTIGLKIAADSGYSPKAIKDLFLKLSQTQKEASKTLSRTHPPVKERLENISTELEKYDEAKTRGVRVISRYKKNINFERKL